MLSVDVLSLYANDWVLLYKMAHEWMCLLVTIVCIINLIQAINYKRKLKTFQLNLAFVAHDQSMDMKSLEKSLKTNLISSSSDVSKKFRKTITTLEDSSLRTANLDDSNKSKTKQGFDDIKLEMEGGSPEAEKKYKSPPRLKKSLTTITNSGPENSSRF